MSAATGMAGGLAPLQRGEDHELLQPEAPSTGILALQREAAEELLQPEAAEEQFREIDGNFSFTLGPADPAASPPHDLEGTPAANRRAFRASPHFAPGLSLERWGSAFSCIILVLLPGFIVVLLWSASAFDRNGIKSCEKPFVLMLYALVFLLVISVFQKELIRCLLAAGDGPEPRLGVICRRILFSAIVLWPLACLVMLTQAQGCSPTLKRALLVLSLYMIVGVLVAAIVPGCFVTAMLYLVRHGLVTAASPEEVMTTLSSVAYDAKLFEDEGGAGCYPSQCPICLEDFDATRGISKTRCRPTTHVFHTECLRGWVGCADTCPICRTDLLTPGVEMSRGRLSNPILVEEDLEAGSHERAGARPGATR